MPSDRAGLTEREATEFAWFDFRPSANEALQRPTRRPRPHIHGNRFGDLEIAAVFDFFHFQQVG
jgi:hypothetical protein